MLFEERDGRYYAVKKNGDVITFEDRAEWCAARREWREILVMLGQDPLPLDFDLPPRFEKVVPKRKKNVRFRVHSGTFRYDGKRLKKEKAIA